MTDIARRFLPEHLLNLARSIIGDPRPDLIGTWPRASALLGRQALEIALDQFWAAVAPGVEKASARAQLICLPRYAEVELARRVQFAWHALSAACHHHAYELPPVVEELIGWLDDVESLVNEVQRRGMPD